MKFNIVEDKLSGGLGDNRKIEDFCPKQVEEGRKVEKEHTDDPTIVDEIVMDHLTENPFYYLPYLKNMEDMAKEDLKL